MRLSAETDPRLIEPIRRDLEAARRDVLSSIANTAAGRRALAELVKSDTYAPVVLARMYRGPDGLYLGHTTGVGGRIVSNVRLTKISGIGSRLLTSAGMLTGHLMLLEVSSKLNRVQKDLGAIREALDDDRMASLRAGIEGVRDALEAHHADNKNLLMTVAIPPLYKAIHQATAALKREIFEVPLPKERRISQWIFDRQPEMRSKLAKSEKTFRAVLEGIAIISQAYVSIGERGVGCETAKKLILQLEGAGVRHAEFKARLLTPATESERPEELWADFLRVAPELIELFRIEAEHTEEYTAEIDVELRPAEIETVLRHRTHNDLVHPNGDGEPVSAPRTHKSRTSVNSLA